MHKHHHINSSVCINCVTLDSRCPKYSGGSGLRPERPRGHAAALRDPHRSRPARRTFQNPPSVRTTIHRPTPTLEWKNAGFRSWGVRQSDHRIVAEGFESHAEEGIHRTLQEGGRGFAVMQCRWSSLHSVREEKSTFACPSG